MPCKSYKLSRKGDLNALRSMLLERKRLGQAAGNSSPDGQGGIDAQVRSILEDVRLNGLEAVLKYTRRFDSENFDENSFYIPHALLQKAADSIPPEDMDIIKQAAANIKAFHQNEMQKSWFSHQPQDLVFGQMFMPIKRAGLYVPGGQGGETPLISSMLMTAIPAQVAGVSEIAVVSPPRADGTINPYILATAHHLGISEVYACGSAWAVAALAYGAGPLKPVDIIAGPGNIWVSTAKRMLIGEVGIDMVAGPSEIAIFADNSARPGWIAADMLGQAEHDPLASSICVITDPSLEQPVLAELRKQLSSLPRAELAAESLKKWGAVVLAGNIDEAFELINEIAPEHLELMCAGAWDVLPKVRAAGAVFVGEYSAESLGDYFAGPNHVLPTMGTARFASGLGVLTFMRHTNVLAASRGMAQNAADSIARLARLEGLEAHARAAEIRKE